MTDELDELVAAANQRRQTSDAHRSAAAEAADQIETERTFPHAGTDQVKEHLARQRERERLRKLGVKLTGD